MDLIKKIINYWDNQPCNVLNSTSEFGTEFYFNENSEWRYKVEPHIRDFAQFYNYSGKRVLEIGCGIGADGAEFAKHGADYTGIDISKESIDIAKKRFEVNNLSGNFYVCSGDNTQELNLEDFDLVYSFGVIHHYPNQKQIINNVYNILRPGGEFKFMVYAKNSWKYAMIKKGLDRYEAQAGCPYADVYTKDDIYNLLEEKFKIERIRQDHCFMYNITEYKKQNLVLEPWFAAMPEDIRAAIKEYLGWHLLVKAVKK